MASKDHIVRDVLRSMRGSSTTDILVLPGILVLQVDGTENTPIGVFANLADARDAVIADERSRTGPAEALYFMDGRDQFLENLRAAVDQEYGAPTLDLEIESGFGSWNIRFVQVQVNL